MSKIDMVMQREVEVAIVESTALLKEGDHPRMGMDLVMGGAA